MSNIVRLTAENFMRLKAVDITADGSGTIIISGKNEQGKTSVLNIIGKAVGGQRFKCKLEKPIREGQDRAVISVETDDGLIVTRTWTKNGTPGSLTIRDKNGGKYSSPQELLDKIIGDLSFDPLIFANEKEKEQRRILLELVDLEIDIDKLDTKRKEIFDNRTEINREVKKKENQLDGMEKPLEKIQEETKITDLLEEHRKASEIVSGHNRDIEDVKSFTSEGKNLVEKIKRLKEELSKAESELEEIKTKGIKLVNKIKTYQDPDLDEISNRMKNVEDVNERIRMKKRQSEDYEKTEKEYLELKTKSEGMTEEINKIDEKKSKALSNAKFPINGLGFDEEGITFKGNPFHQCSQAEKLKVSIAIAMKLNPEFRVLRVTDASLLDEDNKKVIDAMAKKMNFQIWLEVVSSKDEGVGIYIEDGQVVSHSENSNESLL